MKGILLVLGVSALALVLLLSFGIDFSRILHSGSVDFRNRITGARLLVHGIDPYHYIWHPGDPPEYCDIRNNPNLTVSKTTVTPAFLVFYLPLAGMPYRAAQFTWLFAQWLLLLGTLGLWLRARTTARQGWLMALFVTGLTFTPAWRWEAERGQCYVLLAFLLAYWLVASRNLSRAGGFLPGLVAGFLFALRPPFILLVPFIVLHRRNQLIGLLLGVLLGFGVPLAIHPPAWNEYFSAMVTNSDYYRHASTPPRPDQVFPASIEGTSSALLGSMASYPFRDASLYALGRLIGVAPLSSVPLIGILAVLFAGWLWFLRGKVSSQLLPGLAAWLFLADFVLPTTRWGYYDILLLNVFLAGIALSKKLPWAALPCALALGSAWILELVPAPPLVLYYLPAFLSAVGAIGFLFPFHDKPAEVSVGPSA